MIKLLKKIFKKDKDIEDVEYHINEYTTKLFKEWTAKFNKKWKERNAI
jgi:hypothetical protein